MFGGSTENELRIARAPLVLLVLFAALGCNLENEGDDPVLASIYFPNALSLSVQPDGTPPRFLFAASSNFDLRYNAGAVHAFSLDAIDDAIASCDELGAESCIVSPRSVLADEVTVPSFTTAMDMTPDGRALVVTTRTGGSLRRIEVDAMADDAALEEGDPVASDLLGCGNAASRSCERTLESGEHLRTGQELTFPSEPSALITGQLSELTGDSSDDQLHYAVLAHQLGDLSLLIERERDGAPPVFEVSSVLEGLAPRSSAFVLTALARDPMTGLIHVTRAGDSVLFRAGISIDRDDEGLVIGSLFDAGRVALISAAVADLRAVSFAPAIAGVGPTWDGPRALLVSRQPSALVVADVGPETNQVSRANVLRTTEVGVGAARLVQGTIAGGAFAIVSCFEMRELHVIELSTMLTRAVVPNLSGPHALVLDEARERVYVADFRSSVVRIVDLSPLSDHESEEPVRVIASLGRPRVIQELQ